jgi:hypothetical protein
VDAETDEQIEIDDGWKVPRRFTARGPDVEHSVMLQLGVVMDGRTPLVEAVMAWGVDGRDLRPMSFEEVRALPWGEIRDSVVANAAYWWSADRGWNHPDWRKELVDAETASARAVVSRVRRYRTNDEKLRLVLDLHARGGIDLVAKELDIQERSAWRLLARARKELS